MSLTKPAYRGRKFLDPQGVFPDLERISVMATAEDLRYEFQSYLEREDVIFQVINSSDNIIRVGYNTDAGDVEVLVDFDENDNDAFCVHFFTQTGKCSSGYEPKAYIACNNWNRDHRWVKFYVDKDSDIDADCDANIFPGSVGKDCLTVIHMIVLNVEEFRKENGEIIEY